MESGNPALICLAGPRGTTRLRTRLSGLRNRRKPPTRKKRAFPLCRPGKAKKLPRQDSNLSALRVNSPNWVVLAIFLVCFTATYPDRFETRNRATTRRSRTNRFLSRRRLSSSGARRIEEGCTVARIFFASGDDFHFPRSFVTRKEAPNRPCAAVAPRATTASGTRTSSSASSQGRQAATSRAPGFLWMRRFPDGSHLKCFTVLVM